MCQLYSVAIERETLITKCNTNLKVVLIASWSF